MADAAGMSEKLIFAHELTHALQDESLKLDRRMKDLKENGDRALALEGLLEGEATLVHAVPPARSLTLRKPAAYSKSPATAKGFLVPGFSFSDLELGTWNLKLENFVVLAPP